MFARKTRNILAVGTELVEVLVHQTVISPKKFTRILSELLKDISWPRLASCVLQSVLRRQAPALRNLRGEILAHLGWL